MASRAASLPPPRLAVPALPRPAVDGLLMLLAAAVLRCWWWGDPVVQIDEQFYLAVGDRMLHGAVPFVDIWDRKPVGLFLAYAAVRLLGGDGIVQYQLVATVLAAAAAWMVVRVARLHAGETAARIAGVVALVWMLVFDGAGGQAPIFYGPLVAAAALVTLRAVLGDAVRPPRLLRRGGAAMLLIGLAMQMKYTAMFEGVGLAALLLRAWWLRCPRVGALAGPAVAWAGLALLPTAAAFLWYDLHGYRDQFVYANFVSIGRRPPTPGHLIVHRLVSAAASGLPLLAAAGVALAMPCRDAAIRSARRHVAWWAAGALVGALGLGVFFKHYFLPAVLPLSALAAPAFDPRQGRHGAARWWPAGLMVLTGLAIALHSGLHRLRNRGGGEPVARMVAAIRPRLKGCLFVFDGEPVLYELAGGCLPTRYIFPNHLNEQREADAIGVDPVAEVRRVLARRPDMIVDSNVPNRGYNPATLALVRQALARHYRAILTVPIGRRLRIVYRRVG